MSLVLSPPNKQVDKSQKQTFTLAFPSEYQKKILFLKLNEQIVVPNLLLNGVNGGIPKRSYTYLTLKNMELDPVGSISFVVFRDGKEVSFSKCARCQSKDIHLFKNDAPTETSQNIPRNSFVLFGIEKILVNRGEAHLPLFFRCCPTHVIPS